ncbi:PdxT/SNO family [Boletus reticuloceps]|uniref:PdxT/SNO family n=1 Tax=Boletus reticuloceps TaxID=495285 RepID=A0A8I2YNY6_9AGAM|nr:PdxT/SNO family [Boletus reticuloceps]
MRPLSGEACTTLSAPCTRLLHSAESTTIALLANLAGLLQPLREFTKTKPVWGTCAGAILLAEAVENPKKGGQELLNGMTLTVARNGWGPQVDSFEAPLIVEGLQNPHNAFTGIFIRAPVITVINSSPDQPPMRVIARLPFGVVPKTATTPIDNEDDPRRIVAVQQGNHLLTTFHPELTKDGRFHEYFVRMCVVPFLSR